MTNGQYPNGVMKAHLTGQAGVWRVASMLALRGFNPHFPGVDHGYDILVDGSIRLQVKACHLTYNHHSGGSYTFSLSKRQRWNRVGEVRMPPGRAFSEKSEFVILWGIEQDRFWVIPSPLLDGVPLVTVGPDTQWRDIDMDEVRRMMAEGISQESIAKHYGVSGSCINKKLSGRGVTPRKINGVQVRLCENRWDLIQSYLDTLLEIERPSSLPLAQEFIRQGVGD